MFHNWPTSSLAELLIPAEEQIDIQPDKLYKQITVRLWGKGVTLRGEITGGEIATNRGNVARSEQFIMSRIDARHGAFGLVPEVLDGAIVTNDFPLFEINQAKLLPRFLEWVSKTHDFVELCRRASEGTTNRVRLKVNRLLNSPFPLPPLDEQRLIVAHIEALAARIAEARGLRQQAVEEAEKFTLEAPAKVFKSIEALAKTVPVGETFKFRYDLIHPADGESGPLRFIGLQHVESHTGKRIGEDHLLAEELKGRKFRFSPGEIVYGYLRPYLNKVWIADCAGFCSVDQYVIQPKPNVVDTQYLAHYMRSKAFLNRAIELTHNLQLPRLRSGLLEGIPIPIPSLEEQARVVAYLDNLHSHVDALKRLQAETAAELDALLPAVLDRAFRGELL